MLTFVLTVAGCSLGQDLHQQYGLEETKTIVLIRYPQYLDSQIDLKKAPKGVSFLIRGRAGKMILELLKDVTDVEQPPETKAAFALVFLPEEEEIHRTVLLDQYLNLLPGFRYLGQGYGGHYCRGPKEFKWILLTAISSSKSCQHYHVSLLEGSARAAVPGGGGLSGGGGDPALRPARAHQARLALRHDSGG
jgi:hypothetical protein